MASCIGASRAYFLAAGAVTLTGTWHRPGIAFPPGWPDGALALTRQHRFPRSDDVVHVPNIGRLPDAARDALASAGLTGWACATSRTTDGAEMLLGFDAVASVPGHARRTGPAAHGAAHDRGRAWPEDARGGAQSSGDPP